MIGRMQKVEHCKLRWEVDRLVIIHGQSKFARRRQQGITSVKKYDSLLAE